MKVKPIRIHVISSDHSKQGRSAKDRKRDNLTPELNTIGLRLETDTVNLGWGLNVYVVSQVKKKQYGQMTQ